MYSSRLWRSVGLALLMGVIATRAHAQLTELAWYHLGEDDPGAVVGGDVTTSVESLGITPDINMEATFSAPTDIQYSDDTPSYTTSTRSVTFNEFEGYLAAPATAWYNQYPGFRVGMEAFLKVDPSMQGLESVPFADGSAFRLGITADGFYYANATGPGITPVNYGEWQHVAFTTTGSFWQIYVDGVPQFDPLPEFNYGAPSGEATLGNANGGGIEFLYEGLIDEHRVFTWTGAFSPADLLWFTLRPSGDINDDGVVNEEDYNIWLQNVGVDISGLTILEGRALGDANGDRQIDLDDFGIIKENRSSGVSFGIPEPGSCILLLIGLFSSAALLRRQRRVLKQIAIVAAIVVLFQPGDLFAQAVWGGGDGNWNDANWTGGSGTGGSPTFGDTVVLPSSTGTLTVSDNSLILYDQLQQQGGILNIEPAGVLEFTGLVQNGLGSDDTGEINISGQLLIEGGFDVGREIAGSVSINGSAVLRVGGTMDTWWAPGAFFTVTGGNADIEVTDTFYLGPSATFVANIDSSTFSTIKVPGTFSIQGGTLDVNFIDGFEPALGDSWILVDTATRGGVIPNLNTTGVGPGLALGINYSAGGNLGQVVTVDVGNTLNLQVNAVTGDATIENPAPGASALDIDGYIIRSESDSLNPAGFTGLGEPGWLAGLPPGQSDGLLSETNFTASTSLSDASSYSIGQVFKTEEGTPQDLTFEFHLAGGGTLPGTVEYVIPDFLEADFNRDGAVDGDDFLLWQNGFGIQSDATKMDGDYNNDGKVDGDDFLGWQAEFGSTSGGDGSAAVPEPSAIAVALLAALGALAFARRR